METPLLIQPVSSEALIIDGVPIVPPIDLVGSTLSDPYLSYSAALFALAGPLHGYVPLLCNSADLGPLQSCKSRSVEMATSHAKRNWVRNHVP